MTYVVTQPCFGCKYTDCVTVCPCSSFHEGEKMLYINPDSCIDCEACAAECPTQAILPDLDVPEHLEPFIKLNEEMSQICPTITEKQSPLP